jgi:hypothetical protein
MRDSFIENKLMERVEESLQMATTILEISKMAKQMALVFSKICMVVNMKELGKMICSMVKARKSGITEMKLMKENSLRVKRMVRVNSHGKMDHTMKEILSMENSTAMEPTFSRTKTKLTSVYSREV